MHREHGVPVLQPLHLSPTSPQLLHLAATSPRLHCSWSVGLAQFPHPSVKSPSLIGQFAPTFLFASIMFQVRQAFGLRPAAVLDGVGSYTPCSAALLLATDAPCSTAPLIPRLSHSNLQFVLLVHDVVAEKEGRARQMMEVMGLR